MTVPAARAASNPLVYLNATYAELPRLCQHGGSADEVEDFFAGVVPAFEALHVPRGAGIDVRMYPPPWGWSMDYDDDNGVRIDYVDMPARGSAPQGGRVAPAFRAGEDRGFLFAWGGGRWQLWNPADGPAPAPDRDRLRLKLVVLHGTTGRATVCRFAEVYGRDLPLPLYKGTVAMVPASLAETDRLVDVLRGLLDAPSGRA
ncbi:MAG: hypothetical protein Q8P18_24550 [Pseudomonadota bacterium]|nr:hypothetical protein [Pseudomonadota bacterium]